MLIEIFAEIIFLLRSCVKGIVAVREKIRHFALKKKENPALYFGKGTIYDISYHQYFAWLCKDIVYRF